MAVADLDPNAELERDTDDPEATNPGNPGNECDVEEAGAEPKTEPAAVEAGSDPKTDPDVDVGVAPNAGAVLEAGFDPNKEPVVEDAGVEPKTEADVEEGAAPKTDSFDVLDAPPNTDLAEEVEDEPNTDPAETTVEAGLDTKAFPEVDDGAAPPEPDVVIVTEVDPVSSR